VARRRRSLSPDDFVSLLLDSGAVLAFEKDSPQVQGWLDRARKAGVDPMVSYATLAETYRNGPRIQWVLSKLAKVRLGEREYEQAGLLLGETNIGNRTMDALVAISALQLPRPVVVLTTDPRDLERLLHGQPQITVIAV
jgi:hypothetical protein